MRFDTLIQYCALIFLVLNSQMQHKLLPPRLDAVWRLTDEEVARCFLGGFVFLLCIQAWYC